jgi:hypothetical protein
MIGAADTAPEASTSPAAAMAARELRRVLWIMMTSFCVSMDRIALQGRMHYSCHLAFFLIFQLLASPPREGAKGNPT